MPSVASSHRSIKRPRRQLAPLFHELPLYTRAAALVAETRAKLAQALAAPNAGRREAAFLDLHICIRITTEHLEEMPCMTSGLRRRRAKMGRELEAIAAEAAAAQRQLMAQPAGNLVEVDFKVRRVLARRIGSSGAAADDAAVAQ